MSERASERATCPHGPRYHSRTQAKAARRALREPGAVWIANCRQCDGVHLMPTWLVQEEARERGIG